MAIFHLNAKVISRGKGQSAVAAAAYRSGERLRDEQVDEQKFYKARAERIQFTDIMAPKDAPEWAHDRNQLWNNVERAEKRKDAQLAREIEISLPHELTERQREWLVKDFAREAFVRNGYVVDIAIHAPDKTSDDRNHHAHLMVTMRTLGPDGFATKKDRSLNSAEQLGAWREQWAHLANRYLERHGHDVRIDHRSLKEQGIQPEERLPTIHLGYAANEMAERGAQSDRMDELREILARNEIRVDLKAIDAELKSLEATAEKERAAAAKATRPIEEIHTAHARAETEREREIALKKLEKAARADEAKLRDPAPGQTTPERAFADGARRAAQEVRQERLDSEFWAKQDAWRKGVKDRNPEKIQPLRKALEVVDAATGAVSSVGDFLTNLLAGPSTKPASQSIDMRAFVSDPAARKEQQLARLGATREQQRATQALEDIREDVEAGRRLKAEDIRALTRAQQDQILMKGDDAVRQLIDDLRKRSDGRERERD